MTHGREPVAPPVTSREVTIDGRELVLAEAADFPYDDPWSQLTRGVVAGLAGDGQFRGRDILEAGIGDGRNVFAAGFSGDRDSKLIGVELDDWRLALAAQNLGIVGVDPNRVSLHEADIVEWLRNNDGPRLTGWGLACLPQAPRSATENDADGYQDFDSLEPFRHEPLDGHSTDAYGLTLNAAYLSVLRGKVDPGEFDALITLSDRVPEPVLLELFGKSGWKVVQKFDADEPVQQDPDTGVQWVAEFDDGQRFWERSALGVFTPISVAEAEERRLKSLSLGEQAREDLNVYHGLSVYHLQPSTEA